MNVGAVYWSRWRESSYLKTRNVVRTICHFRRILKRDFSGLAHAPVQSKFGFAFLRSSVKSEILTSPLPTPADLWADCVDTFQSTGAWPISFSYPKKARVESVSDRDFMCPIFPGHSYSFADESRYLDMYSRYLFALTHKKGGWDCFRHLEIFAAGSIPFMPDAGLIPKHTMVHYPKKFLEEVSVHLAGSRGFVGGTQLRVLGEYFDRHLTSRGMAEYLLRVAAPLASGKVLYVDEAVATAPDYQSLLSFIGLKQVLGSRVVPAFPVEYVYSSWNKDSRGLYGRGFGYTKVLCDELKSPNELSPTGFDPIELLPADIDLVVVGSITRNYATAQRLLEVFPAERTVWIHGEDQGPSAGEISQFREAGVTTFVRELH